MQHERSESGGEQIIGLYKADPNIEKVQKNAYFLGHKQSANFRCNIIPFLKLRNGT